MPDLVFDKNGKFREDAHAVIIGINEYRDDKIPNLNFARADAESIYQVLIDPELGRMPPKNIVLLVDEEATQRNIRSAIGTKLPRRAGEEDVVYLYYAGHGAPVIDKQSSSRDGMEKYLVPFDADLDDLFATGISMSEIQTFFNRLESKQVLFFIDSCYSGEAGGRSFQNPVFRGRHILSTEFLDNLAGEGRLVITACDVNEVSLEADNLGHGLFTHYFMEGVKGLADKDQDGLVAVHELYEYVYENVSQHARKVGGSMHPIQKGSMRGKIVLTQYETAAQKQAKASHLQAQSLFDAEKFDEADKLWQSVLQLAPEHEPAKLGIAMIQGRREGAQQALKRKQKILLRLRREGKLPPAEFDRAMSGLEKDPGALSGKDRMLREFLDDLLNGAMSTENYLKSITLLRESSAITLVEPSERKPIEQATGTSVELPKRKPIKERLRHSFLTSLHILIIAAIGALVFSGLTIYAVFYLRENNKTGVLSEYTVVIYFSQNDPALLRAANDIRNSLVKYGFHDRLILPQEVSEAFLKAVAPPKGNEIRYQLNEVEAATKLKSVLAELFLTMTFTTRAAQGQGEQKVISIFLANTAGKNPSK